MDIHNVSIENEDVSKREIINEIVCLEQTLMKRRLELRKCEHILSDSKMDADRMKTMVTKYFIS